MKILILAGGTGGHIFPALAVAEYLRARDHQVEWLGTPAGLEADIVPAAGIEIHWLTVRGLRGKGLAGWLLAPWRVLRAVWQARGILRRVRPAVVLGMGGFVSGPGGLAAWLSGRPLVVHEQNAVPGLTNKLLARLARRRLEAFPGSFAAARRAEHVGNPVRDAITGMAPPEARDTGRHEPLRILVLGGSQGALALNRVVPDALGKLAGVSVDVRHQTGRRTLQAAREAYAEAGVTARVEPFIDDMAEAYGWADLVICRAGAMTVAELAAAGVGSILVPFPSAVDDHQTANARYLADREAAVIVQQRDLSADYLARLLRDFADDRERLIAMAGRARAAAMPEAARQVAEICLTTAGEQAA